MNTADGPVAHLRVAPELRIFLPVARRREWQEVPLDGTSTVGHLIRSIGIPLTEVAPLDAARVPAGGEVVDVRPMPRPQRVEGEPRFLLDVHLGTLARRLRLLGLDAAYHNDRDDPELVAQANEERRVLLTQDRGLLHRAALWLGAYVRGSDPDEQLRDVLDRFAPPLRPWTRCTACNGELRAVGKDQVAGRLPDGTKRSYDVYGQCADCGQVYWRGAHSGRLEEIVRAACERVTDGSATA
ncbi:Mut7-C RNAse domain-containing protein [Thermoactinospora rubra]|uniref:Mut7-C RNAse domain-containing protein n=1 Tax=Thermoactinospora rubra TaxID=1088767 RepID=UPI000A118DBD|nr:Mut7-C RNAse domain-containing protein [Thermoactinospora rubra]